MNPEQQNQNDNNNYDFIMNPPNPGNKSPLFAPENTKIRIAIFAGGIILLIILISIVFSFLNSAGNKQKENLFKAVRAQAEIIRVIDFSNQKVSDRELKDKITTLRAVLITSQQETTAALTARGQEINPKELGASENSQTNAALETAVEQARHDETLDEILTNLLEQYSTDLQAVFNEGNASEKELATDAFNQIDLAYGLSQDAASEEESQVNQ